jgi:hypothetical protein
MELESLIKAFENNTPVVLHRPNADDLYFDHIEAITPHTDKRGNPDWLATVVDSVGRLVHCRLKDLEVAG